MGEDDVAPMADAVRVGLGVTEGVDVVLIDLPKKSREGVVHRSSLKVGLCCGNKPTRSSRGYKALFAPGRPDAQRAQLTGDVLSKHACGVSRRR
jgi:hypothetical protein